MASVSTILQGLFILLVGVSVLDFGTDALGINDAIFGDSNSEWWNFITFWAYGFLLVGILQFIKGFKSD